MLVKLLVALGIGVLVLVRAATLWLGHRIAAGGWAAWLPTLCVALGMLVVDLLIWATNLCLIWVGVYGGWQTSPAVLLQSLVWFGVGVAVRAVVIGLGFRLSVGRLLAVSLVHAIIEQLLLAGIFLLGFGLFLAALPHWS